MLRSIAAFFMLPLVARVVGLLLMAGGFVQVCYDGARSIANNAPRVTTLSELLFTLLKDRASAFQAHVEAVAPWLWQALVLPLSLAPAAAVALVLGAVLMWLGQPGREPIGYMTRS